MDLSTYYGSGDTMDLDNLVPAGGGTLSRPVLGPHGAPVATFTPAPDLALDEIWHGGRTTGMTRDGIQGAPLGYQPGHGIEHEPLDQDEKQSQHLVQRFDHAQTATTIRAALRPGIG